MTRNLPEPKPDGSAESNGKQKVHAAVDTVLEPLICRRFHGKIRFEIEMHEGGVRTIKTGIDEIFKHP